MKNTSGPGIDPCGTPVSILVHEEYCPFKTTISFLKFKKSVKNIPQTSRPSSKDLQISGVMDRRWP